MTPGSLGIWCKPAPVGAFGLYAPRLAPQATPDGGRKKSGGGGAGCGGNGAPKLIKGASRSGSSDVTHPPNPIVRALCEFLLLALAALPDGAAPGPYPLDERGALLHVVPTARVEIPSSRRMDAAARCWSTEVTADIARAASLTSMDLMGLNLSASGPRTPFSFPSCSFGDLAGVAPLRAAALARRPRCHLMRSHSPPLV